MKAIKLSCKSGGFKYGETAEVGKGKTQISLEDAKALVGAGLATEVKEVVASSGNADYEKDIKALEAKVTGLEAQVKTLTDDKTGLEAQVKTLTDASKAKK